jgi:signal transduction histidine kinase
MACQPGTGFLPRHGGHPRCHEGCATGKLVAVPGAVFPLRTKAKRSERLTNEFVATVSHELRTPLTVIAGSLGLLTGSGGGRLGDPMRLLKLAQASWQRLLRLVSHTLDMNTIERNAMAFDFQQVETKPLAALDTLRSLS